MQPIENLRIQAIKPVITPALLQDDLPISESAAKLVTRTRDEIRAVLAGEDDRLLVIVGPCSIHDTEAALDYAGRLHALREQLGDDLLIVMRVYFEKPRTTVGWKGLINDPDLDDSFKINKGLRTARQLLLELNNRGVPAGVEFLDILTPQYLADTVSWGAIGARTTESQVHREMVSGLSAPVPIARRALSPTRWQPCEVVPTVDGGIQNAFVVADQRQRCSGQPAAPVGAGPQAKMQGFSIQNDGLVALGAAGVVVRPIQAGRHTRLGCGGPQGVTKSRQPVDDGQGALVLDTVGMCGGLDGHYGAGQNQAAQYRRNAGISHGKSCSPLHGGGV